MTLDVVFTSGFYQSKSLPLANQQCKNFYTNTVSTQGALHGESLFQFPGIVQAATAATARDYNRGAIEMAGVPYFVNGDTLYRLTATNSKVSIGTIVGSGRVGLATNGTQLVIIIPGKGKGYVYTVSGGLSPITDTYFTASGNPTTVEFVDGRFVFSTDESKLIQSDLNNAASGDAAIWGTAEYDPDSITGIAVVNNQLHVIGRYTVEAMQNIGGAGFVYQRTGVFLDKGTPAKNSIISSNGSFFFVGGSRKETPAIWKYDRNQLVRISHPGIDAILNNLDQTEISEISGFSWSYEGNYFITYNLPETTITYNLTDGKWLEHGSTINEIERRWRVNSVVEAYGNIYVGDSVDGRIGMFDKDDFGEYGEDVKKFFTCQVINNNGLPFSISKITLTIESGTGNSAVEDPKCSMEVSRDGKIFSMPLFRSMGATGEYETQLIWRSIPLSRRFCILRFNFSDQVKTSILKLEIE